MAEIAVSFVLNQLFPLLKETASMFRGVHKEFVEINKELRSIHAFLKDADRKAEEHLSEGIETWVEQLREAAFRIEDVIDEYMILVAQHPHRLGCLTILYKFVRPVKTLVPHHRIVSSIKEIKSTVIEIKQRSDRYNFQSSFEQASSSLGGSENVNWVDPRMASLFIDEAEVVGFEVPRDELNNWLVKGSTARIVISVIGMGGLGKTTLAKKVFDNQQVTLHFDCNAFITVSQSYSVEGLLREMMQKFCKSRKEPLPVGMNTTEKELLITEVRHYLQDKRYVVFFDDVWKVDFWNEIQLFVPDHNNGSRVLITTRMVGVAEFCKRSSPVYVHKLQPLPLNKAWELFCKKAFPFECDQNCPEELSDITTEIIKKCGGLPLAIVTIGGLLSTKEKTIFAWEKFLQTLSSELEENLSRLTRILAMSYYDLPYHLKNCFLYFGIYPEDYSIDCVRLVRQWVAEGFIKFKLGKTLEEVGEEYLTELIHRSLVQVSEINFDGKVRRCRIHDMMREMIITNMKKLSFCHFVSEDDQSISNGIMTRRIVVATNSFDVHGSKSNLSSLRSLYFFQADQLLENNYFLGNIPVEWKLLKLLHFEDAPLCYVPNNLENLFHLRYLSLRNTKVLHLPKSIGKLQNLETLDLKQTRIHELPSEIKKLTKLRHLLVYYRNYETDLCIAWETGAHVKGSIGCLTALQKLCHVEIHEGGLDLIKDLIRLRHLKKLGLKHVKREYGETLCASIMQMKHLESLSIFAIAEDEIIDLNSISSPPPLRRLYLIGRLEKLPHWVSQLRYLVRLRLFNSMLKDDLLKPLRNLTNLLELGIGIDAFDGENMHFKEGEFQKLKVLRLWRLKKLNCVIIEKGALPVLNCFGIGECPQLKEVPSGIHNLEKLEQIDFIDMPNEFNQSIDPPDGQQYWVIEHVPFVTMQHKFGPGFYDYEFHTICHPGRTQDKNIGSLSMFQL